MKKLICVGLCLVMALLTMPVVFAAGSDLTVDATWSIRVPASPTAYENFAAQKLRSALDEVFGASVTVSADAETPYIAVGSAAETDVSEIADNGYRIQAIDGNIHINGTGTRGLQVGAYRFLEEFCGR